MGSVGDVSVGGLTTGGAGRPVVGSEAGGFITGGSKEASNSTTVALLPAGPVLMAPTVLSLPSMATVALPDASPDVVKFTVPPSVLETDIIPAAMDPPSCALTTKAVATSNHAAHAAHGAAVCTKWGCNR